MTASSTAEAASPAGKSGSAAQIASRERYAALAAKCRSEAAASAVQGIVERLSQGVAPWRPGYRYNPLPHNPATGNTYRGVNQVFLMCAQGDSPDARFLGVRQAEKMGATLIEGAQGVAILVAGVRSSRTRLEPIEPGPAIDKALAAVAKGSRRYVVKDGEVFRRVKADAKLNGRNSLLTTAMVYHASQFDGLPQVEAMPTPDGAQKEALDAVMRLLTADPTMRVVHSKAGYPYFEPATNILAILPVSAYLDETDGQDQKAAWAMSVLHELAHSTGISSKLARPFMVNMERTGGMPKTLEAKLDYAREEMRAEIATAMMAANLGLAGTLRSHEAYIEHYHQLLSHDPTEFLSAAKDAQMIVDHLSNQIQLSHGVNGCAADDEHRSADGPGLH